MQRVPKSLDLEDLQPGSQEAVLQYAVKAKSVAAKWLERHSVPLLAEVEDQNHHDLAIYVEQFALLLEDMLKIDRESPLERPKNWMGFTKAQGGWAARATELRRKGYQNLSYEELMEIVDMAVEEAFGRKKQSTLAERMAARNFFSGKIQDFAAHKKGDVHLMPTRIADVPKDILSEVERDTLDWERSNSMNLVQGVGENVRKDFRSILLDAKKKKEGPKRLQQRLFEKYADMNGDMRRIAVTETAASNLNSLVSSYPHGTVMEWFAFPNACKYCKSMAGRKVRVVSADDPTAISDWQNTIYVGKTNYGRSFAARKITPVGMVPRTPGELAGPAAPAHPSCRCTLRNAELPEGGEPIQTAPTIGRFTAILERKRQESAEKK